MNKISRLAIIILFVGLAYALFAKLSSANYICDASALNLKQIYPKQKGAHVFGSIDTTYFQTLRNDNIEWVTLVAWANQEHCNSSLVKHHNGDTARLRQSNTNWMRRIEMVRAAGFKVFVKPHVWVYAPADGKWRSDIFPTTPANWDTWKKSYGDFILRYARIAQAANAELFCVGMELSRLSIEKPVFWKNLILDVRSIYSGQITYAANWYEEFDHVTFWDELDYIGIQAYFPLTNEESPSIEQLSQGWDNYLPKLESVHKQFNRKILFTEMGYKSTTESAIRPWEWIENATITDNSFSAGTQANCYQAFFNTVWKKDWFAGVHIWQLRSDFVVDTLKDNLDFTPQGKPAIRVIAKGFE